MAQANITAPNLVSLELAKWAKEQMKFRSTANVEEKRLSTDLLPACKGSAMVALWEKVTREVRTKQMAHNIRQNLELEDLLCESETIASEEEEKTRRVETLETEIESLELQLKSYKEDLQRENSRGRAVEEENRLSLIKLCSYKNHKENLSLQAAELNSFHKWIAELRTVYQRNVDERKDADLEESCCQDVNAICELWTKGLKHQPADVFLRIAKLVEKYPPSVIISALATIREKERNIDFLKAFEDLEKKYMKAEKTHSRKTSTVESMLHLWDSECVKNHLRCLTCNRNVDSMQQQIEAERDLIISRFQKHFEFEPVALQSAIDNLDAELDLASMNGALRSFQSAAARLQEDVLKKTKERDELVTIKMEIDCLSKAAEENMNRIAEMTKHNSLLRSKILDRQIEVRSVATHQIFEKRSELLKSCADLQNAVQQRFLAFAHSDTGKLCRIKMGKESIPLQELSINKYFKETPDSRGASYRKAACSLMLHGDVPPSAILKRIVGSKQLLARAEELDDRLINPKQTAETCRRLKNLTEEGAKVEKQQIESMTVKYNSGMKVVESAVKRCEALDRMRGVWFEQPAQNLTPFFTKNGLSLADWKKKVEG